VFHLIGFAFLSFLLIIPIMGYVYLCPRFNSNLVNAIMFHPDPYKSPAGIKKVFEGIEGEEVTFQPQAGADEKSAPKLDGWLFKKPGAKDIILISHGNAGNLHHRDWKVQAILGSGDSVFIYDYRGYGKSEGAPNLHGIIRDTIGAYDYLVEKQGYQPENIILYGESIGTGFTCELARQRKCKAIVLESGFMSTERLGKDKIAPLNLYPSFLFFSPVLDNLEYLKGSHPPVLILAGRNDKIIPIAHSQTMFEQGTEPKQLCIFEHSGHNDFSADFAAYRKRVIDFVAQLDSQPGQATAKTGETTSTSN
jgi:Prolyl oligopeptidase family.